MTEWHELPAGHPDVNIAHRAPNGDASDTHSADCWQWHHDCAVSRLESVLAVHAPIEQFDGRVICSFCGVTVPCTTVRAVRGLQ